MYRADVNKGDDFVAGKEKHLSDVGSLRYHNWRGDHHSDVKAKLELLFSGGVLQMAAMGVGGVWGVGLLWFTAWVWLFIVHVTFSAASWLTSH